MSESHCQWERSQAGEWMYAANLKTTDLVEVEAEVEAAQLAE